MRFGPFSRPDQPKFLGIPAAKNHCPLRLPTGFKQLADASYGFKHGGGAAAWIDSTVNPGVAMIPGNHPCVGRLAAVYCAGNVPYCAVLIVLLEMHPYPHGARPHVISEGQCSLP